MPLVRIDMREGRTAEYREKTGEIVYQAMLLRQRHSAIRVSTRRAWRRTWPWTGPSGTSERGKLPAN
jgi:hypothetical protein